MTIRHALVLLVVALFVATVAQGRLQHGRDIAADEQALNARLHRLPHRDVARRRVIAVTHEHEARTA